MKKRTLFASLLVALTIAVLGAFGTQSNANAATKWSKNTPTAIRGTWTAKKGTNDFIEYPNSKTNKKIYQEAIITKTTCRPFGYKGFHKMSDATWFNIKSAYNHHAKGSKYYYITGKDAVQKGQTDYYKIEKVGNKLRTKMYGTSDKKGYEAQDDNYTVWCYKK